MSGWSIPVMVKVMVRVMVRVMVNAGTEQAGFGSGVRV